MNQPLNTTPPIPPTQPTRLIAIVAVPKIISDQELFYTTLVIQATTACVSLLGIVGNIFNIMVFIRQGAKSDSTNASLLGLAVTDLTYLVSSLSLSASQAVILYAPPDLPWIPMDLAYVLSGIPNYMFAQITKMATAYIAFQRCVCVVFPFKVKTLFTSGRTCIVFVCIFTATFLGYVPLLVSVYRFGYRFDPRTNATKFGVIGSPGYRPKVNGMLYANNLAFNVGSVAAVLVCTAITVYQLNLSKAWRQSVSSTSESSTKKGGNSQQNIIETETETGTGTGTQNGNEKHASSCPKPDAKMQKERKLVKVIVTISVIFIFTYTPNIGYLILTAVNRHARLMGKNHNLAQVVLGINFLMETTNSSINIVVYYLLSSSYKEEVMHLLKSKGK